MSIYSELQEFREFALEEQVRLNASVNPGQYVSELINEKLDPMLIEIIGSRTVALFGNILVPAVDVDRMMAYDIDRPSHIFGTSNGVDVCRTEDYFPDAPVGHLTLGYSIILGRIEKRSIIEVRASQFYAFGPIASSWLEVPDLRADSEVEVDPEPDDDFAAMISDAVQGNAWNPDGLTSAFDTLFEFSRSQGNTELPLRVHFYLEYLNKITRLSEFMAKIKAEQYYAVYGDGTYRTMISDGSSFQGRVSFTRFDYSPILRELCLVKGDSGATAQLYFPINEITEADFTVKSTAESL